MPLSVIIVESLLQLLTNKKDTLKIILVFPEYSIISTTKIQVLFKSEVGMPMAIYFDFETTAPANNYFNPEQKKCLLCLMF